MIKDMRRNLMIWISCHPVVFAMHFIVVLLILFGGTCGWAVMFGMVMFFFILISSFHVEYLIPLSYQERKKRILVRLVFMVLYANLLNLCGTLLSVCVYGRIRGDFICNADGEGKDLPLLIFWLVFIFLMSLQQGVSYVNDHLSGIYQRKFNVLFRKDGAGTLISFAADALFLAAVVVLTATNRLLAFSFLPGGKLVEYLAMAAILLVLLWDVIRLVKQIEIGDFCE